MGKLTQVSIRSSLAKPGRYRDGDGLMLLVSKPGLASWVARFQQDGKRRDFGLGSLKLVSLAEAREKARAVKKALVEGRDPLVVGRPPEGMLRLFREVALEFIGKRFSGPGHAQAAARLRTYVFPTIGKLQLQSIDAQRIANCIEPIWQTKPETALRVRALIIRTLRYGRPDGPSLAGTLARAVSDLLPPQRHDSEGFAALPWESLPSFMERLATRPGMGALVLRFAILTAARSGEARGATWTEIDLEKAVWNIPAPRMKGRRSHSVPLSTQALEVLREAASMRCSGSDLVFPSAAAQVLSDMTVIAVLRRMGEHVTVHGFRSTFRDYVADELLDVPDEIAEASLAHQVPDKIMAAYKRTTFFALRRNLVETWGRFAMGEAGAEVVPIASARKLAR